MKKEQKTNLFILLFFILLTSVSLLKIQVSIESTILGYRIGELKLREAQLLRQKSLERMRYTQITTKQNLEDILNIKRK